MHHASFVGVMMGDPDDLWLLTTDDGYGFVCRLEDMMTRLKAGKSVVNSPLFQCALCGNDPNWGRIISSTGAAMAGHSLPAATLDLCGVRVVAKGSACPVSTEDRVLMTSAVKLPEVEIELDLGVGHESTEIYFADLGHEYITINAEYHS